MYFYKEDLINLIVPDKPDPAAAKVLQETLGGRFGEMRTMMQFFFQSSNFRGKATQYRDLIRGVFWKKSAMSNWFNIQSTSCLPVLEQKERVIPARMRPR